MSAREELRARVRRLGLHGLLSQWERVAQASWIGDLIEIEEAERARRSLERRIRRSRLGRFKPMADFDWSWPKKIDRELVEECLSLSFLSEAGNVVLIGPNGVGKTMIAVNIAPQALLGGYTVLRITASEMLSDLAMQETSSALNRRLRRYTTPGLLLVDEVGYLSYDDRAGDLLFQVVSRRDQQKSTLLTTNRAFGEWNEVFPRSSCVTALVDRLLHRAEIVLIEGESYRAKEAKERTEQKAKERARKRRKSS
jgi:DNA replication protein DnaC